MTLVGAFGGLLSAEVTGRGFTTNWVIAGLTGCFIAGRWSIYSKIGVDRQRFDKFITERLISIRDRRPMWGEPESVELQVLTLIESEHFMFNTVIGPRDVIEVYQEELRLVFPKIGNRPLSDLDLENDDFNHQLFMVAQQVRLRLANR